MTLSRQLWLAVITVALLAFTGSFFVSTVTARNYLEDQLSIKNSDNAASLALSMSQSPKDLVTIELQVAAMYDSGQYTLIRLRNPDESIMIEKVSHRDLSNIPTWFRHTFPIEPTPGTAQVSDGWTQFASIELMSQTNFAYQELWRSTVHLFFWFLLGSMLVGIGGSLMLKRITRPLSAVVKQAQAITRRQFIKKPEPSTPELKSLARAMNEMVDRLKSMFEEEASRLEAVRREANQDPLTGLSNRNYFMSQLQDALQSDENASEGELLLLRIANLSEINRRAGRESTDALLCKIGQLLAIYEEELGAVAARLNGADFALLLPGSTDSEQLAQSLLHAIQNLGAKVWEEEHPIVYIAYGPYQQGESLGQLLSRVDNALASAESNKSYEACKASPQDSMAISCAHDWRVLLEWSIEHRQLCLVDFPVHSMEGTLIHRECPLRLKIQDSGEWLTAGRFMPAAIRLNLTPGLDLATLSMALGRIASTNETIAVNISGESVRDAQFRHTLIQQLHAQPKEYLDKLWLEIAEPGAFQHFDAFVELCEALKPLGCQLGIEHFGRKFSHIGYLHKLGLDYLKVDSSFIHNIHEQPGNQAFLKGLCQIAHNIGLIVIAEGVRNQEELSTLAELGFDGATGPFIRNGNGKELPPTFLLD